MSSSGAILRRHPQAPSSDVILRRHPQTSPSGFILRRHLHTVRGTPKIQQAVGGGIPFGGRRRNQSTAHAGTCRRMVCMTHRHTVMYVSPSCVTPSCITPSCITPSSHRHVSHRHTHRHVCITVMFHHTVITPSHRHVSHRHTHHHAAII
jgi:hypothetical protein